MYNVYMHVCVYVCMIVCVYACICTCMYMYVYVYVCICICVSNMHMYIYRYSIYLNSFVFTYIYIHTEMCPVCAYIHLNNYIHINIYLYVFMIYVNTVWILIAICGRSSFHTVQVMALCILRPGSLCCFKKLPEFPFGARYYWDFKQQTLGII